jgi:hypothetical protein
MVHSVVEWTAILANLASSKVSWRVLYPSRSGFEGRGRHACVILRVGLTEGRRSHSGGHGGVLSSRTPTALGMMLQCPGWRRGSGDGRIGLMMTEETYLTGPTSWRRCGRARDKRPFPF